jgi:Transmembrane domain of unknown function (DUF3566)
VSSPNDPGYPRSGDGSGTANGAPGHDGPSVGGAAGRTGPLSSDANQGRVADSGDVPPWQRGRSGRPAKPAPPRQAEAQGRGEPSGGGNGGVNHPPGVDARLNRFLSGGSSAAPAHEQDGPMLGDRNDVPPRPETYASELPDLSGPMPRPPQRKPAPERQAPQEPAGRPAAPTSRMQVAARHQGPVRASMQIRRVDPWSVLKVSLVLSSALFFVWMIAVAFLYLVLGGMGVWSKLNSNVGDLLTSTGGSAGGELVSSGTIFGGATLIGLVNIVLLTAMATIGAFIYNLTTDIVGGVEVTLADRD